MLQIVKVIYFKKNVCKFGTPYGESKITSEVKWMQLKICHGNERPCLFVCLVYRRPKAQPYCDLQIKDLCFHSHRTLKIGLEIENKSLSHPEKFDWIVVASLLGGLEMF